MEQAEDYRETLSRFHEKASILRESKLLRANFTTGFSVTWNESGLQVTAKQPEDTNLLAYLTTFRQFILKGERINLDKIYVLCQAHLKDDKLKGYLLKSQGFWKKASSEASVALIFNGREMTPWEISDLFLYGGLFHGDKKKEEFLRALLPHELNFFMFQFLEFVQRTTDQILYVDNFIVVALKDGLFS